MSGLNNYQKYLIESSYKNLKDKPNTSSLISWYEESGELKHRVDLASIWVDADYIPYVAPTELTENIFSVEVNNIKLNILKLYEKLPLSKVPGTKASFYNKNLIDSIESSFGQGYTATLFDSNGKELPFGLNKWVVDTESGVLTFIDGLPTDFTSPFSISFYRYIGRKGNESLIKSDGSVLMDENYVPTEEKSIVTKDYVDASKIDFVDILKKLIPNNPSTFEGTDLELITPHRKGFLVTSTDLEIKSIYKDLEDHIIFKTSKTWDQEQKGYVAVYINNNRVYVISLVDLFNGDYNKDVIRNLTVVDSYQDKIVADDFYKSYELTIALDIPLLVMPFISSLKAPIANIYVQWYNGDESYKTNDLLVGLDYSSNFAIIADPELSEPQVKGKYISGVPALVYEDKFNLTSRVATLKNFRKDIHGHFEIEGITDFDITTKSYYDDLSPLIEQIKEITIPNDFYTELLKMNITSTNLDGKVNGEKTVTYKIRVDSKSSEINRVTSPNSKGENYGDLWSVNKQMQSLTSSNELQMLGGKYQWPRGNYIESGFTQIDLNPGPNYDTIKNGIRYVTLAYDLKDSSGFYFTLDNAEGFDVDKDNFTIKNIESLKCIISGKNEWLNMNQPYDGVLNPYDLENKGCLVVDKSNETTRYCTFGTEVLKGKLLICLGIPYNLNIKFSGITVLGNI